MPQTLRSLAQAVSADPTNQSSPQLFPHPRCVLSVMNEDKHLPGWRGDSRFRDQRGPRKDGADAASF